MLTIGLDTLFTENNGTLPKIIPKYVYLLKIEDESAYKIGISKSPQIRLDDLQTGSYSEIRVLQTFKTVFYSQIEQALHAQLAHKHLRGEWFDLDVIDVVNFTENCKKIESDLQYLAEQKI